MAECHPVGFQWVTEAKERGATIIHVDPRFTRTSALVDLHVPLRAGTDIAFLGGIVRYILENDRWFHDYVVAYTNAATILREDFRDTEDLDGLFSGFDPNRGSYDVDSWQYSGQRVPATAGHRESGAADEPGSRGAVSEHPHPQRDPTLQHPRCVFQVLRRHFARYTPEMVASICGIEPATVERVAEHLCANSGRERTSAIVYSVGWTHHSVGVQYIRTASIIQLLLGNVGRPGGGILALRGHASIQGSTDIPTLYNLLPGYIAMPQPASSHSLEEYVDTHTAPGGFWGHMDAYITSLLRAWYGDNATADNEYLFGLLPRITGDHSHYPTVMGMYDGSVRGYFLFGENPAVGSANSRLQRLALARLDWLVVRDLAMIESATFWNDSPEVETGEIVPEECGTEVFFMPAAAHTEKDGTFTNTQRLLQWHHAAVEPQGDCRSDLWFIYHLGRLIRQRLRDSGSERDRLVNAMTWDYGTHGAIEEPSADDVLREISGFDGSGKPLSQLTELRADGSTRCGCWVYCGVYANGVNQAARRRPGGEQSWVAPEWGWAWPANRRILYNRASADPDGTPWSERKAYVWWDAQAGRWTGRDVPDFAATTPPDYRPGPDACAEKAISGDTPFIMQSDGRGWLFVPQGLVDGPLPTHYEPHESPVRNPLYEQHANPVRQVFHRRHNEYNNLDDQPSGEVFPYAFTTYRLTEHHTAGGMSRFLPVLSELQPAMFCEVSPELAAERGLSNGDWATIVTARTAIEARVLVTHRIPPLRAPGGGLVHQVGLPYHWGTNGRTTGDAANDLLSFALDPNVHIQEAKAATCDIRPGRRPRGPALRRLVEEYQQRALSAPPRTSS
jgi:formate dehydrogenase major subunit